MRTVAAFPGQMAPIPPGEPDPDIVAILERYLADAKAGGIVAIAIAAQRSDLLRANVFHSPGQHQGNLGAAILALAIRYGAILAGA